MGLDPHARDVLVHVILTVALLAKVIVTHPVREWVQFKTPNTYET